VTTAVVTLALLAGPLALLVAGPLLQSWGAQNVFFVVAAGELLACPSPPSRCDGTRLCPSPPEPLGRGPAANAAGFRGLRLGFARANPRLRG
jgi:hypothetical protein